MNDLVIEKIMDKRNFKTQTHELMRSTHVPKHEAISMIISCLENRIEEYSNEEITKLIDANDNVFLYKITYSRKDAERMFFKERDRTSQLAQKLQVSYQESYQLYGNKHDMDKAKFVVDNVYDLFTENTAMFVKSLLSRGERYVKDLYHLTDKQFYNKLSKITKQYIPKHRQEINRVIENVLLRDAERKKVVDKLINAHTTDHVDASVQHIFKNNKKICEELVGECDTPYIHEQNILLNSYADASKKDKQAFVRYLIKIEKSGR